jgi:hypothetical protein
MEIHRNKTYKKEINTMKTIVLSLLITSLVIFAVACDKKVSSSGASAPSNPPSQVTTPPDSALISREPAQNAAPLGVEVGYANLEGVKEKLGSITSLQDNGIQTCPR